MEIEQIHIQSALNVDTVVRFFYHFSPLEGAVSQKYSNKFGFLLA